MKNILILLAFTVSISAFSQSKKISQLPTATDLNSSFVPIIQDSSGQYVNRKLPGDSIRLTPLVNNGLSLSGDTVQLGGILNKNTTITGSYIYDTYLSNGDFGKEIVYNSSSLGFSVFNETGRYKDSNILLDQNYLSLITIGKTFKITTDTSDSFAGTERLKIDSVGNINMPNTYDFNVVASHDFLLTNNTGNSTNSSIEGNESQINIFNSYLNSTSDLMLASGSLGYHNSSNFVLRLSIDSVGNIDFGTVANNLKTFSLYSDSLVIDQSIVKQSIILDGKTTPGFFTSDVGIDLGTYNQPFNHVNIGTGDATDKSTDIAMNGNAFGVSHYEGGNLATSIGLGASGFSAGTSTNIRLFNPTVSVSSGDGATINRLSGRFRKDTSGSSFTLTDSFITSNSIILLTLVTTGVTTGYQLSVQAGTGSAIITFETAGVAAAPNIDCDVNFVIIN